MAHLCKRSSDNDRHKLSAGKPLLEDGLERIKDCDLKFVLGHHPLDWFLDTQLEPIRALLGRHNVIYLHGHMHKGHAKYEEGAGYPFLDMQSGAGFQAREDDLWVNRFLWCELNLVTREISAEPLQWSSDNQGWVLDSLAFPEKYRQGDRWILSLPPPAPVEFKPVSKKTSAIKLPDLPKGWVLVNTKYLRGLAKELTSEQALSFFDGRTPIWREALTSQIPRREVVRKLVQDLETARIAGGLHVKLLIGAAGEGKTTALLQTVVSLVNITDDWHILWHDDLDSPLPAEYIARLPKGGTWLIVSDDAEVIARRVFEATQSLTGRQDMQFLLCCRDTDWKAEGADRFDWRHYNVNFAEVPLRGLSTTDAEQVVTAWSRYGKDGLKELINLAVKDASFRLIEAAKSEETNRSEGTFFGAILQVRLGNGLKDHVRNLLEKLNTRSIGRNRTLKDAFMYIAAMHAENLQFLSREVLAEVLEFNLKDLKREVLYPLGEEAAIATTGHFVFTRHRAIADVALKIISDEIEIYPEDLYIELARSSTTLSLKNVFVPELGKWHYLSSHFFNKGNHTLGIRLAQTVLDVDPNNPYLIVKLAQLYREVGQPEQSLKVFRSKRVESKLRGYYSEWGISEGRAGHPALSVWLHAFSLADQASQSPPANDDAKLSLNSMSFAFTELYDMYNTPLFIEAGGAAAQLGLEFESDVILQGWLQQKIQRAKEAGIENVPRPLALERIKAGVISAWGQKEEELPGWVIPGNSLSFRGLEQLLRI